MSDQLQQQLRAAHDPFAFVIERPEFYRSTQDFEKLQCVLRSISLHADNKLSICIDLALVYAKRMYSQESYAELVDQLLQLRARAASYPSLLPLANAVSGVIALTRGSRYENGIATLEEVRNDLRFSSSGILYGVVQRWLANGYMYVGRVEEAEVSYQDALSVARRYDMQLLYATALNDYAVHKKRVGEYTAAREMLRQSVRIFEANGSVRNIVLALVNLGNVGKRIGDWKAAEHQFRRARAMQADCLPAQTLPDTMLSTVCTTTLEHLLIQRRAFDEAKGGLIAVIEARHDFQGCENVVALAHEFLAELCLETGDIPGAKENIRMAHAIASDVLPGSDVMTEILRRQSEINLIEGSLLEGALDARKCIMLARRIRDHYELGAATRVLGEIYADQGNLKRAAACFRSAIRGLKSIHECYELMRALYAQGVFLSKHRRRDDAEISLLEARQLAKKLELDYYQALIAIALVDTLSPQERFNEASTWLTEATTLRDNLEGIDRERVDAALKRAANELQDEITKASIREAETLKTICRVYEDARFPIAEMKPDLAYQVAQSAGGDWLFVAARKGGGFTVPLTYNIAVNEAKDIVRRLDDGPKRPLLGVVDSPRVFSISNDRTLVAVPCLVTPPSRNGKEQPKETFVFCTCFAKTVTVTSRQMEILNASSEALARLIEDEDERHAPPTQEEIASTRHPRGSFKDVLTIDPGMIKLIKLAEKAAGSVAPILLEGETGVGKELFARAIHDASRRKDGPFVAVNAGGMSLALLESELFGHVRGAFTDASSDRVGFVDTARGGTLFLDEIGETSEELQVKLLRLIENGEYRRLGESTMRKADVRFVSATNRDLSKEVERGRFRRDLYYRVAPLRLTIPPLRFRTSDIQLMIRHFLRECAQMNSIADRHIEIDVKAMEALELYDWPGNVRELFNEILRVVSLIGRGDLVRFSMLSDNIQEYLKNKKRGTDGLLERSVEQYERRLILHALERNDWNHLRTAESIGVPRTTLLAKLKRLNIASKL